MTQSRYKSKAAWATLLASVVTIAALFLTQEEVNMIQVVGSAVLLAVEAFGVFNNPTVSDEF